MRVFLLRLLPALFLMTSHTTSFGQTAMPPTLDAVSFAVHADGEDHKMVVTLGAPLVRIDEPDDRYSIIYDPHGQDYIGLEHSNYTYWEFSWPAVRSVVASSKRYETHLRDLITEGSSGYDLASAGAATNGPDAASDNSSPDSTGSDNPGYIWKQTTDKKKIADLDCVLWSGDSSLGESIQVWCYPGLLPKVQAAMETVRAMNEPMALVPVRTLLPSFVFPVYDALIKGGVTPVEMTWGGDQDKNHFAFTGAKTRENKPGLFSIPKLYIKTTLVTMDGMTNPPAKDKKQ